MAHRPPAKRKQRDDERGWSAFLCAIRRAFDDEDSAAMLRLLARQREAVDQLQPPLDSWSAAKACALAVEADDPHLFLHLWTEWDTSGCDLLRIVVEGCFVRGGQGVGVFAALRRAIGAHDAARLLHLVRADEYALLRRLLHDEEVLDDDDDAEEDARRLLRELFRLGFTLADVQQSHLLSRLAARGLAAAGVALCAPLLAAASTAQRASLREQLADVAFAARRNGDAQTEARAAALLPSSSDLFLCRS